MELEMSKYLILRNKEDNIATWNKQVAKGFEPTELKCSEYVENGKELVCYKCKSSLFMVDNGNVTIEICGEEIVLKKYDIVLIMGEQKFKITKASKNITLSVMTDEY